MKTWKNKNGRELHIYLDVHAKLIIECKDIALAKMYRTDFIYVYLKIKKTKMLLVKDFFFWAFEQQLLVELQECLEQKRELPESIVRDIGFLKNIYYNGQDYAQKKFDIYFPNEKNRWLWDKYELWSSLHRKNLRNASWLYNDSQKRTKFLITPEYIFTTPTPFNRFLQRFKPLFEISLSDETVKQLIVIVGHLVEKANENSAQHEKEKYQFVK